MLGLRIPMLRDSSPLRLATIIEAIGQPDWAWRIFEFSGIGVAPHGMSMTDFEQEARKRGYGMTADEFVEFARANEQVWDCLIVGLDRADVRTNKQIVEQKFADVRIIVEGVDSTNWEIKSRDAFCLQPLATTLGVGRPTRMPIPQ